MLVQQVADHIRHEASKVLVGQEEPFSHMLVALLAGGHILLEGVPGTAKTLMAKTLAMLVQGDFKRIQFTPDLMPSDVLGTNVYELNTSQFRLRRGPIFTQILLADEINRAPAKTQSALLEAMEERQVTVDGVTHPLPEPFFLVATQNPFEHAGTFPLVEGQRDRFAVVIEMGLPGRDVERELVLGNGGVEQLDDVGPVTDPVRLQAALSTVRHVHCDPAVASYVVDLVAELRANAEVRMGPTPRASITLLHAARAQAVIGGRSFVSPDDVKAVAPASLAHRLILAGGPDLHAAGTLVRAALERVPVPRG